MNEHAGEVMDDETHLSIELDAALAQVARLEAAIRAKDAALRDAYASAHATYMSKELFPNTRHSGGFADCPTTLCINRRAALSPDAGKGKPWQRGAAGRRWRPPEVGEQVASRLRSASRVFHSEHGHEGPWSECKHLQCSQDRAALDALKGVE